MKLISSALLVLGVLGLCLAVPKRNVRWCTTSPLENAKCSQFRSHMRRLGGPFVTCVTKSSHFQCIQTIAENKADAVTLDSSLLYLAGQPPYNLRPVVAEVYGTKAAPQTHYYAVAVARKGTNFQLNNLRGVKSCHTGLNRMAGWTVPLGVLHPFLKWNGPPEPLQKAVSEFFSSSCVPCADEMKYPKLCQLCAGTRENKCACSSVEPYFGYSGALQCLTDGAGDVAFVRGRTVLENLPNKAQQDQYELLCPDNTRKPVNRFRECHLARVPSHVVVARSVNGNEALIWKLLQVAQEKFGGNRSLTFQLFGSFRGKKNQLFKDSTIEFLRIPSRVDAELYLGFNLFSLMQNLTKSKEQLLERSKSLVWCSVGSEEESKCQRWSVLSQMQVTCTTADTTEDCIAAVMKGKADALSLDGGHIYIAGKCGLVPVLVEKRQSSQDSDCVNTPAEGYLAVAVVRKENADITWNFLNGTKSCHTGLDRTAGWNIPMGLIFNNTGSCKFGEFFSQSCVPGADPNSNLCALCIGDEQGQNKCAANSKERYQGYTGAFRCLVERTGDVAFIKDTTAIQNTDGKNNETWARNVKLTDFELLCLNGNRKPVTDGQDCHLAMAPGHAVVSRADRAHFVRQVLLQQQTQFGKNGKECPETFCLFQSKSKNLLFNDNTDCLAKLKDNETYETHLGPRYISAIAKLRQCSPSELLQTCAFLRQ
ncbi:lactotransferrin [Suncus etruscus]|uniref:lactotransferrin n=1 Tax=Suncus etruscus TaxID=109475 RepID=UPI00211084DC|nr:lactotransferrin [Suncus etruscus]